MFGIGITEIIIIMVVALLVVGPKKLPELAKTLGRGMAEFRRTADDFKESIYQDDSTLDKDRKKAEQQHETSKILYPVDPPDPEDGGNLELSQDGENQDHENVAESQEEASKS